MLVLLTLGVLQGAFEWLPVSSEGIIVLVSTVIFENASVSESIETALFLHMGTFFATLVYFRKDILALLKSLGQTAEKTSYFTDFKQYKEQSENGKVILFIIISTIISGLLGYLILDLLKTYENDIVETTKYITFAIGIFLVITGILQRSAKRDGIKSEKSLTITDGILLGVAQGFAALPGLSRSGLTVSALLFRKFDDTTSLRLSFLMSMPIVLLGNIVLNLDKFVLSLSSIVGLTASFGVGLITIHILLIVARKLNFGIFVIIFGLINILAALIT